MFILGGKELSDLDLKHERGTYFPDRINEHTICKFGVFCSFTLCWLALQTSLQGWVDVQLLVPQAGERPRTQVSIGLA